MSSVDELIEQAQSFSAQHRREDAASCLFNAADLILKQNEKLPPGFKRMSLYYELYALAKIELLKESKFDLIRIDEIIYNFNKIIELGEDSRAILIWNPHIKYFKTLKYCLSDSKIAKKKLDDLCKDIKTSDYFAESLVYIFCQINSLNYNDKNKIERINKIIQEIDKIKNTPIPPDVIIFFQNLSQCLKKLNEDSDDKISPPAILPAIEEFRKVFTENQEDVYTLIGDQIYKEFLSYKKEPSKFKKIYKNNEWIIAIIGFILTFLGLILAVILAVMTLKS